MKNFRTFGAAIVLTLMLAHSAFAGDISFPVAPPEPPGRAAVTEPSDTPEASAVNSVTEVALNLLQSVLSLF